MAEATVALNETPTALALVQVSELEELRDPVVGKASELVISDQPTYEEAGAFLTEVIKPTLKKIAESCGPVVKAAHAAHKAATTQKNELEAPLKEAERLVKTKIGDYEDEQERLAAEEARRLREEEARLERERQQREAAARREAQQREVAALRKAEELEAAGKNEEAAAALEVATAPAPEPEPEPERLPAPPPRPAPRAVQGVSSRKVWKTEVTDPMALIRAVAAGQAPANLVTIDTGKLDQLARAMDGAIDYPGVRVYQDRIISGRAK